MKLKLDDITVETKELAFTEPDKEVNQRLAQGPLKEYRVEGPYAVRVAYYRTASDLIFQGRLSARVGASCARCAEQFAAEVERDFRFLLMARAMAAERGGALGVEDLELSLYDGDEIDLGPLLNEQLLLALPSRPLCREDCRGLCQRCGANLNLAACGCEQEPDRLAVLAVRFRPGRRA